MNKINHIAIIMDGNGRWGKKKGKNRNFGHQNGIKVIEKIVKSSIKINVPILTFYTFSSENWKRPKKEISFLFKLINFYFIKEINNLIKNNIKINVIGNIKILPKKVRSCLIESMRKTKKCNKILVNLAINYGSHNEIIEATKHLKKKKLIKKLCINGCIITVKWFSIFFWAKKINFCTTLILSKVLILGNRRVF